MARPVKKPKGGEMPAPSIPYIEPNNLSSPPEEEIIGLATAEKDANKKKTKGRGAANHTPSRRVLPLEVKHRIVELFATFHTHAQVAEIIEREHGLSLDKNLLAIYDPARVACSISGKLREYYQQVRKRYVEEAKDVAIAHQAHRLRKLEVISDKALHAKDFGNAIKALEIAAKEMGGLLEAGKDSKVTVEHRGTVGHVHASLDDARSEVAMRLAAMVERIAPPNRGNGEGAIPSQVIDIEAETDD